MLLSFSLDRVRQEMVPNLIQTLSQTIKRSKGITRCAYQQLEEWWWYQNAIYIRTEIYLKPCSLSDATRSPVSRFYLSPSTRSAVQLFATEINISSF